jgi:Ca2+-binding EF-hand superfamily protein
MSSNGQDAATAIKDTSSPDQSRVKRNLELIWLRIDERFNNFAHAFRFFDMNFNNRVSFNEFSQGIETLKVKITLKEQMECFNHLDGDRKEYITYDDFCGLTKERR